MLNEKWGWFDAIASIFCFVGVLFVAKPKFLFGGESVRMILVIDHRAFKLDICICRVLCCCSSLYCCTEGWTVCICICSYQLYSHIYHAHCSLPELLHDSYLPMAQKTIACTGLVMACINRFPGCWSTGRDRV